MQGHRIIKNKLPKDKVTIWTFQFCPVGLISMNYYFTANIKKIEQMKMTFKLLAFLFYFRTELNFVSVHLAS